MSEAVLEAIYNLRRYGHPQNDPPSAKDIDNLIARIIALAEALSDS